MSLYALPELVRLIATKWPTERLEKTQPTAIDAETLEIHTEGALRALIWLADHYDWGQAALDDWRAEQDAPQLAPGVDPEASTGQPSDPIDELRDWAKTIEYDRLHKHVLAVPGAPSAWKGLRDFIDGKRGNYRLHNALRQVRVDLADYA